MTLENRVRLICRAMVSILRLTWEIMLGAREQYFT